MKRAVAYVRVSSEEQVNNASLDTQTQACREHCERNGIVLDKVFREEGKSAKTTDRPALKQMLTYCRRRKGGISYLLVYDLKRFSRDLVGHFAIRGHLRQMGIGLRSVTEAMVDETKEGQVMEAIVAAMAEYDNRARAERVSAGMKAALERGRWPFPPPLGYQKEEGQLVVDPKTGPLVREAFELAASGLFRQSEICQKLDSMGLRGRRGARVGGETIRHILTSPIYAGRYKVGGKLKLEGEGAWEPIVDRELWLRAQGRLVQAGPACSRKKNERDEFPLRGVVRCAASGRKLTASYSRSKTGNRYGYYHTPGKGATLRIRRSKLHDAFLDLLRRLQPSQRLLTAWRASILEAWDKRSGEIRRHNDSLHGNLASLKKKREHLLELLLDNVVDRETYQGRHESLSAEIARAEIEAAENRLDELDVETAVGFAEQLISSSESLWLDASLAQRQRIQRVLFPEGLAYSQNEGFRTPVTRSIFMPLVDSQATRSGVVERRGFEPPTPTMRTWCSPS